MYGQSVSAVFKQKYHGDVTIVPRFTPLESIGLKAICNPSKEVRAAVPLVPCALCMALKTWPRPRPPFRPPSLSSPRYQFHADTGTGTHTPLAHARIEVLLYQNVPEKHLKSDTTV